MNKKLLITLGVILGITLLIGIKIMSSYVSVHDKDVSLVNSFNAKIKARSSFYDNMGKTFSEKWRLSTKVDSSFSQVVQSVMSGRSDGQQVMMKWVTEQNPTRDFNNVSDMYKDLSNLVESKRSELVELEKSIGDIVREQHNLHDKFWSGLYLSFTNSKKIEYTPITSDRMEEINRTSKDNNSYF